MTQGRTPRGRFARVEPPYEPPAPLLEHLRFIARATVRRVFNDPRTTTHVERCVLHWIMNWDPVRDQPIRQYIGLRAGNEARRIKALKGRDRDIALGRSHDLERLMARTRGVQTDRQYRQ